MNIGLLPLLQDSPLTFLIVFVTLALSMAAHEMGHAFAADRLGDPTPRHFGKLTLNPLAHLQPLGLIMLVLIGFGFASTPVNEARLSRWGRFWVAAAGPLVNLAIAILVILLARFGAIPPTDTGRLVFEYVLTVNVMLLVLNLLPIPLLDGSRMLGALVPSLRPSLQQFEQQPFSPLIIMAFFYLFSSQLASLRHNVALSLVNAFGG